MSDKNTMTDWLRWTKIFSILIAIHSFFVGIFLMFFSTHLIQVFGFIGFENNFFRAQGGIFHVVMSVSYILPVINFKKFSQLIYFSIVAKFIGTTFLISYYFIAQPIMTVLLSGISDFLMGLILLLLFRSYLNRN